MKWSPAYGVNSSNNSGTIFLSSGTGVAWNGSMWVAVGDGTNTIAYSINGQYWYPSNNSMNIFSNGGNGIAWNGTIWVAVGGGTNTIAYSSDGINWTGSNNSTTIFSYGGYGIAWNGTIWVAVGGGTNSIAYSSDGINWTGANNSTTIFSYGGDGIAWNGEIWVAVGEGNNTIAYSSDGINWTGSNNSTTIFSLYGSGIAWNGSLWVAVGEGNNSIAYSSDGINWTGVGTSIVSTIGKCVTWYAAYNMWIVVGGGSYDIGYSRDGINWYPVNNSANMFYYNVFNVSSGYGAAVASTSSVVFYTNQGNTNNIATINNSGSQITINDVGSFQIQASLAATSNFLPALSIQSNPITIVTGNVILLSNNFSNFVYGGGPYTLSVTTNNTDTNPPPIITYTTPSNGLCNISGNTLTVIGASNPYAGSVYIYVNISQTQNFNAATIPVSFNIAQATPTLVLNTQWINQVYTGFCIGESFYAPSLIYSNSNTDSGLTYSYSINPSNIASYNGSTIYLYAPGSFTVTITSNPTTNFSAVTVNTPSIYICVVPEVIIFNNPQTFPPTALQHGEIGMAICINAGRFPYGFSDYTAVTITNGQNGFSITMSAQTALKYSSILGKYMVFFEPDTAGSFSGALSTSTASNIAYADQNHIVDYMVAGGNLNFTFTGNNTGTGLSTFAFNWNSGSLNISQGFIYGAYYTLVNNITTNVPSGSGVTISTLNSGSITGYYTAPWAGYNTISITGGFVYINPSVYSDVQQAWGLWINGTFGSTYNLNGNNYYVGIPQLTNPVTP